jgi:hypothetical protein
MRFFWRSRSSLSILSRPPGQRPVRMVLSAIPTPHSRRGIGTTSPWPWYPTFEIVPPGRVARMHAAKLSGLPTASIAESTPR